MKVMIQRGALISQDFAVMHWPDCTWPDGQTEDPDLMFDAEWKGRWWECSRPGFGERGGWYGNGSIFVHAKDGVIPCDE